MLRSLRLRFIRLSLGLQSSLFSPLSILAHLAIFLELFVDLTERISLRSFLLLLFTVCQLTLQLIIVSISRQVLELSRIAPLLRLLTSAAHSFPFMSLAATQPKRRAALIHRTFHRLDNTPQGAKRVEKSEQNSRVLRNISLHVQFSRLTGCVRR